MTWQFVNPFTLSTPTAPNAVVTTDTGPQMASVFDGRCLWVGTEFGLKKISFWGPYSSETDEAEFIRREEPEVDMITKGGIGPKLVVEKTTLLGFTPRFLAYGRGYIFATNLPFTTLVVINASSGNVVTTVNVVAALGGSSMTQLAYVNRRLYFIGPVPTTQELNDGQTLYYYDVVTASAPVLVSLGMLPDRKQKTCRYLTVANDILYVSSYNNSQVHKYNIISGAYLTSLTVNRDITKLYSVDNEVYALSRASVIGDAPEELASLVSHITQSDTIDHKYAVLGIGETVADEGAYLWGVNSTGLVQRTNKSNLSTYYAGGEDTDYKIGAIEASGVKSLLITPALTYEYWNGATFVPVTVPQHLFLLKATSITAVRLPSAFRWGYTQTLNQYTAVSTGGRSYKSEI